MKDEDIKAAEKLSAHEGDVLRCSDTQKVLVKQYLKVKRIGTKRLNAIIAHAESIRDYVDPSKVEGTGRLFPDKSSTPIKKDEGDDRAGQWMGRMLSAHLRERSSDNKSASILLCVCPGCGAEMRVSASMEVKT